jgi:hypothetical protein
MRTNLERNGSAALQGSLFRLGDSREIAVYVCGGVSWVAEFKGGSGKLYTAGEWFRLNGPSRARRTMNSTLAAPLPVEAASRIEALHQRCEPPVARQITALFWRLRGALASVAQGSRRLPQ